VPADLLSSSSLASFWRTVALSLLLRKAYLQVVSIKRRDNEEFYIGDNLQESQQFALGLYVDKLDDLRFWLLFSHFWLLPKTFSIDEATVI